jgi:hypothetical protein
VEAPRFDRVDRIKQPEVSRERIVVRRPQAVEFVSVVLRDTNDLCMQERTV